MSKTRVKTTYEVFSDPYGTTETRTLYCVHNNSCDITTFYEEDGSVADMIFEECVTGHDKWDAVLKLMAPFKDPKSHSMELIKGVEYFTIAPWEEKTKK